MLRIQIINLWQGHLHVKAGNCTLIGSIPLVYPSEAVIPKTVLKDHTGSKVNSYCLRGESNSSKPASAALKQSPHWGKSLRCAGDGDIRAGLI